MRINLKVSELDELKKAFIDLLNYDSDDPTDPINPLTYIEPGGDNCLHIAAHRGDYRSVELLLRAGIDVNSLGEMNCTALHYAISNGHQNVADLLIKNGASTSLLNKFGKLPTE